MEKEKRKGKPGKNYIPLMFAAFFLSIAIAVCLYPIMPRYNMTPFFASIENSSTYDGHRQMEAEAEARILEHVTTDVSTRDEIRDFVERTLFRGAGRKNAGNHVYLPHCDDYYPQEMLCHTDESVVFLEETRWVIRFGFENDILTSLSVGIVVYGLQ